MDGLRPITIQLKYFARLREELGLSQEQVKTTAATASEFFAQWAQQRGLKADPANFMLALNGAYAPWTAPLHEGDEVVFLLPLSGG